MSFESHNEVSRSTPERGISHTAFQSERLGEGRNFECNLSVATDKLAKDGVLPQVEIDNDRGSDRNRWERPEVDPPEDRNSLHSRPNIFDKFDGDKNGKISGTEWSTKFDNLAGEDQSARLEDFQKEFGDNRRTKRFFERADQDHDNVVSGGEFLGTFDRAESNGNKDEYLGREEFREIIRRRSTIDWNAKPGFPPIGGEPPVDEPPPKWPVPPIEPPRENPRSPYQPSPPINSPEPPVARPQPERPAPPVERPGDRPSTPVDQPARPTTPTDNGGEVPRATPEQVETLFNRIERRGASDRYMQEIKQALAELPASVVQAAIDGRTRIIANGQGPQGLGGTYNSATNSINMYETSPFNTKATLAAEMFHNWDLNPFVGKHISSQPWFQQAFQRARGSGIATGDNTFSNGFEFIHHMARYYSGFTGGTDGQLMNFLGADYRARTRQALLS